MRGLVGVGLVLGALAGCGVGEATPHVAVAPVATASAVPTSAPQPDLDPSVNGACTDALRGLAAAGVRAVLPGQPLPDACAGANRGTVSWMLDVVTGDQCAHVVASRPRDGVLDDSDGACVGVAPGELREMGVEVGRPFPHGAG